ncbi:MAG: DUF2490 domain-containing protein [Candidatus Aureabacteria bacterium]|nr:DUF2490 domain-containing protein [Candidatus Auribacterota bacterium]NLW94612.1 DUF2490 domain-containing protein [Chlamydiota bacterium]HOE27055.1 DUF2490 domain-containing protein [bacterium]HQM53724.1 DUF2490 domain-containing protein [bacterium]
MKRGIVIAGAAAILAVRATVCAGDDWKMWNKYAFKLPLVKKKADLNASFETRFREDIDEFYRYQFYMGPDYHLYPWLTLGWQYGNIQEGEPGEFRTEHRFMHFVTPRFKLRDLGIERHGLGDLACTLENRLDWRIRPHKAHRNSWQYRIYPKISYPIVKRERFQISPFVADAFYFDLADGIAYRQNRIYGGLSFKLLAHLNLDVYYMRLAERAGRGGDWDGGHVIGTGVSYAF